MPSHGHAQVKPKGWRPEWKKHRGDDGDDESGARKKGRNKKHKSGAEAHAGRGGDPSRKRHKVFHKHG